MEFMANLSNAKCPNCGKIANGRDNVEKQFGIRDKNGQYPRVQSWCFDCRNA